MSCDSEYMMELPGACTTLFRVSCTFTGQLLSGSHDFRKAASSSLYNLGCHSYTEICLKLILIWQYGGG